MSAARLISILFTMGIVVLSLLGAFAVYMVLILVGV